MTPLLAVGATLLPFLVRQREEAVVASDDDPGPDPRVDVPVGSVASA
jgi:hypothetical protein